MNKGKLVTVAGLLAGALALALVAAACEEEEAAPEVRETPPLEATEVEVRLLDGIEPGERMAVELDSTTIPAGRITFVVVNEGEHEHELEVFPYLDGEKDEELGEVEEIAPGSSKSLTLDLEPGRYELACHIKDEHDGEVLDHYELGMHTDITVQ